jgi:FkbM family methyltransferase
MAPGSSELTVTQQLSHRTRRGARPEQGRAEPLTFCGVSALRRFSMSDPQAHRRLSHVPAAVATRMGRRKPRHGEQVTSYAARDAKGIPLDLRLGHFLDWRKGFFVEAGANDGLFQSNTALLEKSLGWGGILVEPAPEACRSCRRNRQVPVYNCALVAEDYQGDTVVGDFDGYPMGSVGGSRLGRASAFSVPARTLQSILDEHEVTHVDFLSLDAEGYELEILRGCDFSRASFSYMLIELYPENHAQTVGHLEEMGYELVANYSNYNQGDNPEWDGTHNDYLFRRRGLPLGAL